MESVALPVRVHHSRGVDNGEVRLVVPQLPGGGPDKHVVAKKGLPGFLGHDPDVQGVPGVGAGPAVKDVCGQAASGAIIVVQYFRQQGVEHFFLHLAVHRSPPDIICRGRLIDNKAVQG